MIGVLAFLASIAFAEAIIRGEQSVVREGFRWLRQKLAGWYPSRRAKIAVALLLVLPMGYCSTVNYLEPGEAGITWNPISGEIGIQDHAGFQLNAPWVFVTTIDTRPQRLCITSSAHAAVTCRLAQFDTAHYREFIAVEGWRWYWWSNRWSFNSGHDETYRGFRDVLRGYAFSSQPYPFVRILREYQE